MSNANSIESTTSDDEDDNDPTPSEIDSQQGQQARKNRDLFNERCKIANIAIEEVAGLLDEGFVRVMLNCGREKRPLLAHPRIVARLLDFEFEKYVFLAGHEAICMYERGYIEAGLKFNNALLGPSDFAIRKLFNIDRDLTVDPQNAKITLASDDKTLPQIEISLVSKEFSALLGVGGRSRISLKLHGCATHTHDSALKLLKKIASSTLFQLDLLLDVSLSLERERKRPNVRRSPKDRSISQLSYPKQEYDDAPISLYFYGRGANGMPLLQYLAYYQVIEFYFPIYSQSEAHAKVKNILKDPLFQADRDNDVSRLLAAISASKGGAFGDERAQLRATLLICLDAEDLRAYLNETEDRKKFFTEGSKSLSYQKISLNNPSVDLRADVAERIYNIRCKIVHSKADARDGGIELLLPYSKEAEMLPHDIALVEYIAKLVLIAGSRRLNLHS